jgi:hypothetical protein
VRQWLDAVGNEIKAGDYFAHATQRGDRCTINFGRVVKLACKPARRGAGMTFKIQALTARRGWGGTAEAWEISCTDRVVTIERLDCLLVTQRLPPGVRKLLDDAAKQRSAT